MFKHQVILYTQAMFETYRYRKFTYGLSQKIKEVIIPISTSEFPTLNLVEKTKFIEFEEHQSVRL